MQHTVCKRKLTILKALTMARCQFHQMVSALEEDLTNEGSFTHAHHVRSVTGRDGRAVSAASIKYSSSLPAGDSLRTGRGHGGTVTGDSDAGSSVGR